MAGAGAAAGKTLLSGTNTGKKFVDWIGKDKEKTALTSSLYSYANPSTPSGRVKMAVGSAGAKRIAGTLVGGGVGARIKLKGYQQMTEDASLSPEKREMARKRVEKLRSGLKISQPTSAGELMAAEATYNSKIEKIIADRTSELKKSTGGVQMSRDYELEMADEITKAIEPLARQKALLEETKQLAQSGPVSRASIEQLVENYKTKPLATGAVSPAAEGVRAASEISAAVAAARTAPQTNMQKVSEILELNEQSALTIAGMAGAIVITGGVATVSALTYWKNRKRERERIANYTKNKTPLQTKP